MCNIGNTAPALEYQVNESCVQFFFCFNSDDPRPDSEASDPLQTEEEPAPEVGGDEKDMLVSEEEAPTRRSSFLSNPFRRGSTTRRVKSLKG